MNSKRTRLWSDDNFLLAEHETHCYSHHNCSVGMHLHTFIEINVISDGFGIHHIHNTDISVQKGNVFIIPQNTPHSYKNINNLTVKHILISNSFFKKHEEELNQIENYNNLFKVIPFLTSNNSPLFFNDEKFKVFDSYWSILRLNNLTHNLSYEKTATQKSIASNLILSFISYLCSIHTVSKNFKHSEHDTTIISKAIEYISLHHDEKLTNQMLADLCNLSESTFTRYFNKLFNMSPAVYIAKHRVNHAKILLEQSNLSITEIAQETGFFDSSHFNRTFKKIIGITPLSYKNTHKSPQA